MAVLVVSIDGAVAERTRRSGLTDRLTKLGLTITRPITRIRSVFPSSTAPAHQSIVTGLDPLQHGITGNFMPPQRCSDGAQTATWRHYDPTQWLGPYLRHPALPSLASTLDACNVRWSSVHFPGLVDPQSSNSNATHDLLLYGPDLAFAANVAGASPTGQLFAREFSILAGNCASPSLRSGDAIIAPISADNPGPLTWYAHDGFHIGGVWKTLPKSSKATHVLTSPMMAVGSLSNASVLPSDPRRASCTGANASAYLPDNDTPGLQWLLEHCLRVVEQERPEVLFARFNHTDHVQELLEWATKLEPDQSRRADATNTVHNTYSAVAEAVGTLASAINDLTDVIVISDHGITPATEQLTHEWICSRISPGNSWELVSCDSSLIRVRMEPPQELCYPAIRSLARYGIDVRLETPSNPMSRRTYSDPILSIHGAAPVEFVVGDGPPRSVKIGAHGYQPTLTDMDAVFAHFARPPLERLLTLAPDCVRGIKSHIENTLSARTLIQKDPQ